MARNRVKVKANSKPLRLELPFLPARGAHQAPSAASGCSLVASKAEEVKKVKEVLLLKSSSSSSSSSTTTTTTPCGLGGSAVLYLGSSLVVQQLSVIALHYCELLHFKTDTSETPPTVNELYLHLHTVNHDGVTFIDTRSEWFYLVDDEAVYYKVASECPKGRVYDLGSLGRKKRRYADPGASTSQVPQMVPHLEFDNVVEQLRQVVVFMQRQFGMTMDGAGLSQPPPPPPPPPQEQQQAQTDPADPRQQHDNVDREMRDWLTGDEQLGDTYVSFMVVCITFEMRTTRDEQLYDT
ncbi:hypothetical protein Scep_030066 [Stephania cephalantha]|uniref:Uncharacterized protein n=1 Tax=Stephania cephalantha TaxID=152367 RepID=A0AAP0HI77_9MAGN